MNFLWSLILAVGTGFVVLERTNGEAPLPQLPPGMKPPIPPPPPPEIRFAPLPTAQQPVAAGSLASRGYSRQYQVEPARQQSYVQQPATRNLGYFQSAQPSLTAQRYTQPHAARVQTFTQPQAARVQSYTQPQAASAQTYTQPQVGRTLTYTQPQAGRTLRYTQPQAARVQSYTQLQAARVQSYTQPQAARVQSYTQPQAARVQSYTQPQAARIQSYTQPQAARTQVASQSTGRNQAESPEAYNTQFRSQQSQTPGR